MRTPRTPNPEVIEQLGGELGDQARASTEDATRAIVETKNRGGRVMLVLGSGPNLHEGVTTLVAELIAKGIVDGVTTSSAVIAHEMAGTLDRVKRVQATDLGFPADGHFVPMGGAFEFSEIGVEQIDALRREMVIDDALMAQGAAIQAPAIIKAAGNMAYPMGLRTENLSREILSIAQIHGVPFEQVAGWGADPRTMIGAGSRADRPVLVTVPQLIGGGNVGICIADSLPIASRCARIADMIAESDVIIESAVALTQEIHDGPFECYTGHGIWAHWNGMKTCSLRGKTIVRIDLDDNLLKAREAQRVSGQIQEAIDKGLPKTKITGIPFRMEMSAFARLPGSIPIVGDIGIVWPVMASRVAAALGMELDFMSYPQQTDAGRSMREWIVENVRPVERESMLEQARTKITMGRHE